MSDSNKTKNGDQNQLSKKEDEGKTELMEYHFENLDSIEFVKDFEVYALCMAGAAYC